MTLVENMVFHQLEKYREQANRERFILPKTEEIELFKNIINKSVEFFYIKSILFFKILKLLKVSPKSGKYF
jgi:hypothetical protein